MRTGKNCTKTKLHVENLYQGSSLHGGFIFAQEYKKYYNAEKKELLTEIEVFRGNSDTRKK